MEAVRPKKQRQRKKTSAVKNDPPPIAPLQQSVPPKSTHHSTSGKTITQPVSKPTSTPSKTSQPTSKPNHEPSKTKGDTSDSKTQPPQPSSRSMEDLESALGSQHQPVEQDQLASPSTLPMYDLTSMSSPMYVMDDVMDAPPLELPPEPVVASTNAVLEEKWEKVQQEVDFMDQSREFIEQIWSRKVPKSHEKSSKFFNLVLAFEDAFKRFSTSFNTLVSHFNHSQDLYSKLFEKTNSVAKGNARCLCGRNVTVNANYSIFKLNSGKASDLNITLKSSINVLREDFLQAKMDLAKFRFKVEQYLQDFLILEYPFNRKVVAFDDGIDPNSLSEASQSSINHIFDCLLILLGFSKFDDSCSDALFNFSHVGPILSSFFNSIALPHQNGVMITHSCPNLFNKSINYYINFIIQKILCHLDLKNHRKLYAILLSCPGTCLFHKGSLGFPLTFGGFFSDTQVFHILGLLNYFCSYAERQLSNSNWQLIEEDLSVLIERLPVGFAIKSLIESQFPPNDITFCITNLLIIIHDLLVLLKDCSNYLIHSFSKLIVFLSLAVTDSNLSSKDTILSQCCNILFELPQCWSLLSSLPLNQFSQPTCLELVTLIVTGEVVHIPPIETYSQWKSLDLRLNKSVFENPKADFLLSVFYFLTLNNVEPLTSICFSLLFEIGIVTFSETALFTPSVNFIRDVLLIHPKIVVLLFDLFNQFNVPVSDYVKVVKKIPKITHFAVISRFFDEFLTNHQYTFALTLLNQLNVTKFSASDKVNLSLSLINHHSEFLTQIPKELISAVVHNNLYSVSNSLKHLKNDPIINLLFTQSQILARLFLPTREELMTHLIDKGPVFVLDHVQQDSSTQSKIQEAIESQLRGPLDIKLLLQQNALLNLPLLATFVSFLEIDYEVLALLLYQFSSGDLFELLVSINQTDLIVSLMSVLITKCPSLIKLKTCKVFDHLNAKAQLYLGFIIFSYSCASFFDSIFHLNWLESPSTLSFLNNCSLLSLYSREFFELISKGFSSKYRYSEGVFDFYLYKTIGKTKIKHPKPFKLDQYVYLNYILLLIQQLNFELNHISALKSALQGISNHKLAFLSGKQRNITQFVDSCSVIKSLERIEKHSDHSVLPLLYTLTHTRGFLCESLGTDLLRYLPNFPEKQAKVMKFLENVDSIDSELLLIPTLISTPSQSQQTVESAAQIFLPFNYSFILKTVQELIQSIWGLTESPHQHHQSKSQSVSRKKSCLVNEMIKQSPLPKLFINESYLNNVLEFPSNIIEKGEEFTNSLLNQTVSEVSRLAESIKTLDSCNYDLVNSFISQVLLTKTNRESANSRCLCGRPVSTMVTTYTSEFDNRILKLIMENRGAFGETFASSLFVEHLSRVFVQLDQICHIIRSKHTSSDTSSLGISLTCNLLNRFNLFATPDCIFRKEYMSLCSVFLFMFGKNETILDQLLSNLLDSSNSGPIFDFLLGHFHPHECPAAFPRLYAKVCQSPAHVRSKILTSFDYAKFISSANIISCNEMLDFLLFVVDKLDEAIHKVFLEQLIINLITRDSAAAILSYIFKKSNLSIIGLELFVEAISNVSLGSTIIDVSNVVFSFLSDLVSRHPSNLITDILGPTSSVIVIRLCVNLVKNFSLSDSLSFKNQFNQVLNNSLGPFFYLSPQQINFSESEFSNSYSILLNMLSEILPNLSQAASNIYFGFLCDYVVLRTPSSICLNSILLQLFSSSLSPDFEISSVFVQSLIEITNRVDFDLILTLIKSTGTFPASFCNCSISCGKLITLFRTGASKLGTTSPFIISFLNYFIQSFNPQLGFDEIITPFERENLLQHQLIFLAIVLGHLCTFSITTVENSLDILNTVDLDASNQSELIEYLCHVIIITLSRERTVTHHVLLRNLVNPFYNNDQYQEFLLKPLFCISNKCNLFEFIALPIMVMNLPSKFIAKILNTCFNSVVLENFNPTFVRRVELFLSSTPVSDELLTNICLISCDNDWYFSIFFVLMCAQLSNQMSNSLFTMISTFILNKINSTFAFSEEIIAGLLALIPDLILFKNSQLVSLINSFTLNLSNSTAKVSVLKKVFTKFHYSEAFRLVCRMVLFRINQQLNCKSNDLLKEITKALGTRGLSDLGSVSGSILKELNDQKFMITIITEYIWPKCIELKHLKQLFPVLSLK
ncbi:hypothetical protein P9112_006864 [Eukaryota sp. TZLM1-RC]